MKPINSGATPHAGRRAGLDESSSSRMDNGARSPRAGAPTPSSSRLDPARVEPMTIKDGKTIWPAS
jgi:hypothetical protein